MKIKKNPLKLGFIALLCGFVVLANSCKTEKDFQDANSQLILETKNYVISELSKNDQNPLVKTLGIKILWDKAIVDQNQDVKVPIEVDFSKRRPRKNRSLKVQTNDTYELYVKKNGNGFEANVIHFIKVKDKYVNIRFSLNGKRANTIKADISKNSLDKLGVSLKATESSSAVNSYGSDEDLFELFEIYFGEPVMDFVLVTCPDGLLFDLNSCQCEFPDIAGVEAPKTFYIVAFYDGSYDFFPGFDEGPSTTPDPEYPTTPTWPGGGGSGGSGPNPGDTGTGSSSHLNALSYQLSGFLVDGDSFYFSNNIPSNSPTFNNASSLQSYLASNSNVSSVNLNYATSIIDEDTKIETARFNLTLVGGVEADVKLARSSGLWSVYSVKSDSYGFVFSWSWTHIDHSSSTAGNEITVILYGYINYNVFLESIGTVIKDRTAFKIVIDKITGKMTHISKL